MSVELLVEWELAEETEVFGENLPQCHFVYHKSLMTWPGLNPGHCDGKPVTNHLSCDTASSMLLNSTGEKIIIAFTSMFSTNWTAIKYVKYQI
jgi:hypothetical protein